MQVTVGSREHLAHRAAGGCRDSMGELYEAYVDTTYRWLLRRTWDPHLAEDLNAETWYKVMAGIGSFPIGKDRKFVAWVFVIAKNVLIDQHRTRTRRPERLTDTLLDLDSPAPGLTPEELAIQRDLSRTTLAAVNALPHKQQAEVLLLRFYDGLSVAETAAHLGITEGAVRVRQHRAIATLRVKNSWPRPHAPATVTVPSPSSTREVWSDATASQASRP